MPSEEETKNVGKKNNKEEANDELKFFDRVWNWFSVLLGTITIEPAYFLYALGFGLYDIASQEIYIEKTCR